MLINKLGKSGGDSEEGFRRSLRTRMWTNGIVALYGAAVIISVIISTNGAPASGNDRAGYQSGFGFGLGFAFVAGGLVSFLKTRAALNNPDHFRKSYTQYTDERNRFIAMKTYQTAASVFIALMALATMFSALYFDPVIANTLSVCLGSFGVIIVVVQMVIKRKY